MKNQRRIAGVDGEVELPEEIIQRIQSFLNGKEAARSTILSKSWGSAWSTRPNLYFNQRHFVGSRQQFENSATETVRRYENLGLNIESLMLESCDLSFDGYEFSIVDMAMKLGAVELDISLCKTWPLVFVLPDSVLQSQTLTRLSLTGVFTVDLERLACSTLKSLRLSSMKAIPPNQLSTNCQRDLFSDLLSRFPLLERLELEGIRFPEFDKFHHQDYHKLEYLRLEGLSVDTNLIISFNFPFLRKLVIRDCSQLRNIRICSDSLERINIKRGFFYSEERSNCWDTEIDVPNIRKIKFEGYGWSRLVLKTTCTKWEADIRVEYFYHPTPEWFVTLSKFLNDQFSLSKKVSLSLFVSVPKGDCTGLVGAAGLPAPPPVMDKLMLVGGNQVTAAFLDSLFLICRPKLIVRRCRLRDDPSCYKNLWELLNKRVVVEKDDNVKADHLPGFTAVHFRLRWPGTGSN